MHEEENSPTEDPILAKEAKRKELQLSVATLLGVTSMMVVASISIYLPILVHIHQLSLGDAIATALMIAAFKSIGILAIGTLTAFLILSVTGVILENIERK